MSGLCRGTGCPWLANGGWLTPRCPVGMSRDFAGHCNAPSRGATQVGRLPEAGQQCLAVTGPNPSDTKNTRDDCPGLRSTSRLSQIQD